MFKKPLRTRLLQSKSYLRYPSIPQYLLPGRQMPCCPDHNSRPLATVTNPDWARVERPGATPHLVYTKPLVKSEQDDRDYRIIRLENGLQATLVHDGKADKAAASLDVAVGHLYDPVCLSTISCLCSLSKRYFQDDMPGLAHFCEHLLFMVCCPVPEQC